MLHDDPLSAWILYDEALDAMEPSRPRDGAELTRALDTLDAALADGKPGAGKKRDFSRISGFLRGDHLVRLPPSERERAEALYDKLFAASGAGRQRAEEALLSLIGYTADPASVPFFVRTLDLSRRGDRSSLDRHRLTIAGLAHTAILHKNVAALEALHAAAEHPRIEVRAEAVLVLGRTVVDDGGPLDVRTAQLIVKTAESDPAFEPRFLARGYLVAAGIELELPPADAVMAFDVRLGGASRVIELKATDTIDSLAHAILDAYGFDTDHMYAFYMNGKEGDPRFELSPFETDHDFGKELLHLLSDEDEEDGRDSDEDGEDDEDEGDERDAVHGLDEAHHGQRAGANGEAEPFDDEEDEACEHGDCDGHEHGEDEEVEDIPIGLLGLPAGHEFLFLYDFGEPHRFEVTVVDTDRKTAADATYPRVVDSQGRAPSQYRN